jgi:hypothetical protein
MAALPKPRMLLPLLATLILVAVAAGPARGAAGAKRLSLHLLSGQPQFVTGENALIAVDVPKGQPVKRVQVRRNGRNVTKAFHRASGDPHRLVGLVGGLRLRENRIAARVNSRNAAPPSELSIYDSRLSGPVFSGPWQSPFFCTTSAAGLGQPTDGNCSAPRRVQFFYRTTGGAFQPLADPSWRPADLAQTTTRDGRTVPYIVRVESGVIDRSIYRWAVLAPNGRTGDGWNKRFVYTFGGGCSTGYQQGDMPLNAVLDNRELSQGYAVLASSLNRFQTACNDVLSAEAAMMVKEHVIESLSQAPVWTIGEGSSGGSIQIQMMAQNYPGILDGLIPGNSFPDNSTPAAPDCRLLQAYFGTTTGSTLSNAERKAITGLSDPDGCVALDAQAKVVNASQGCDSSAVPASAVFDPATNPGGIRCSLWDSMVNVYGRDPQSGLARRTLDNVGVQYGLAALQGGAINLNQFLNLNEQVGGFDANGDLAPTRSAADPEGLRIAYRTGRIDQGAGGYRNVPVIDVRDYTDNEVNVHQYVNTYELRARLRRTNGTSANQVMWRARGGSATNPMHTAALETMGRWLDRITADHTNRAQAQKVIADKPADAVDACWMPGGVRIDDPAEIGDTGPCTAQYPPHSLPRLVAGQPLGDPVIKCTLRSVDPSDYGTPTPTQVNRLNQIFPDGVCDYSKPGPEQQGVGPTWQEFGPKRVTRQRHRTLKLAARTTRRRSRTFVRLTARLRPCPETMWQRIVFQQQTRGKWHSIGTGIALGRHCQASIQRRRSGNTVYRSISRSSRGYAATISPPRRSSSAG